MLPITSAIRYAMRVKSVIMIQCDGWSDTALLLAGCHLYRRGWLQRLATHTVAQSPRASDEISADSSRNGACAIENRGICKTSQILITENMWQTAVFNSDAVRYHRQRPLRRYMLFTTTKERLGGTLELCGLDRCQFGGQRGRYLHLW